MYENKWLEYLSMSNPAMMITFHLLVAGTLVFYGTTQEANLSVGWMLATFVLGYLSWTFAEYLLHRYLFHFMHDSKWMKAFHYAMHGYHHDHPNDYNRLFMPPVPAALFLLAFFFLFRIFTGNYIWFYLPGFELGYLTYALVHYTVHIKVKPKGLESLWLHHTMHHYRFPEKAFGVSTTLWDRIFGTMPDYSTEVNTSTNAH